MNAKYLIFGATGSIGSSLTEQLKNSGYENVHLVARNENEVKNISDSKGYTLPFTVDKIGKDQYNIEILGEHDLDKLDSLTL